MLGLGFLWIESRPLGIPVGDAEGSQITGGTVPVCFTFFKMKCDKGKNCDLTVDSFQDAKGSNTGISADTKTSVFCGNNKKDCGARFIDLKGCNRE